MFLALLKWYLNRKTYSIAFALVRPDEGIKLAQTGQIIPRQLVLKRGFI